MILGSQNDRTGNLLDEHFSNWLGLLGAERKGFGPLGEGIHTCEDVSMALLGERV